MGMKRHLLAWFFLGLLVMGAVPVLAQTVDKPLQQEAETAFKETISLWHDNKLDELYERMIPTRSATRESFVHRLASAQRKPVCCWQMVQDVRVNLLSPDKAKIRATIGFESAEGKTQFSTKTFSMVREDNGWKLPMTELVSLAGPSGKKAHTRKHRRSDRDS